MLRPSRRAVDGLVGTTIMKGPGVEPGQPAMERWLPRQAERMVLAWQGAIQHHLPEHLATWTEPARHVQALEQEWNTLRAVLDLDLDRYVVGSDLRVLDLGAGTGWLSLYLSRNERIAEIYTLDSSPFNLEVMLPGLIDLMGKGAAAIRPILGFFTPLLVGDGFFDVVVASSAVHHAENLQACLDEVYRAIRPGGIFLILNETPIGSARYLWITLRRTIKIATTIALRRWDTLPGHVSAGGLVTDPRLGDRAYCGWQWKHAIEAAGFHFERIDLPYGPYRNSQSAVHLTHFVARKPAGA